LRALRRPAGRRLLRRGAWPLLPLLRRPVDALYLPWNATALSHLPLLRFGGIPSLLSCRGSQVLVAPHDPARQALAEALPATFEAATRVHCVSRAMLEQARARGLDAARGRVIRPAVDPAEFAPPERRSPGGSEGPWRLLSVGTLTWVKGYEDALVAVRGLVERGLDVRYDIVGAGEEQQRLLFTIHDMRLASRVRLLGQQDPRRVRRRLERSHLFVLPSWSEGISNAALEAMACGLPVVASRAGGGMAEAIESGREGLLVPPQDPAALEAACASLLENFERAQNLGRAARARVEKDFSLDRQIEAFRALFSEILGSGEGLSDILITNR
ncbi:MAG: glycosyltransferase family 4 protein, partial [Acidobacteriota bacterium]